MKTVEQTRVKIKPYTFVDLNKVMKKRFLFILIVLVGIIKYLYAQRNRIYFQIRGYVPRSLRINQLDTRVNTKLKIRLILQELHT
mmetsp:Transcript_6773/g.10898  ORF Transcript_6773/g.10898 Transcript_6773/m.10898 type:complete len:85 (-) Transcript_6773:947-1201(-)